MFITEFGFFFHLFGLPILLEIRKEYLFDFTKMFQTSFENRFPRPDLGYPPHLKGSLSTV